MVYIYRNAAYFKCFAIQRIFCYVRLSQKASRVSLAYCPIVALSVHISKPGNRCSIFLRYVGKVLPDYTDAHPEKIGQECTKRGMRLPNETKFYVNVRPRSKERLCLVLAGFHHAASLRLLTLHWIIASSDIY